jgi:hypothetical protein
VTSLTPTSALAAEGCASRSEVRAAVSAFVQGLHDDIASRSTRLAIENSLVETLRTFRGEDADTAAERRAIGQDISALATQLRNSEDKPRSKALRLWIMGLQEQRERGAFTADVRALMAGIDCTR